MNENYMHNNNIQLMVGAPKPSISSGLAAIGSASALIYGISNGVRWWKVILLMAAGAGIGRGVGYVLDNKKGHKCKCQEGNDGEE